MPNVLVFDVNETLLELRALDAEFERAFGSANVRGIWFAQFIQNALLSIVTDAYIPFGTIGGAALEQVAARLHVTLAADAQTQILDGMKTLPPHPEVPQALHMLRDAGFRLCALTNSTQAVADAQLAHAGIAPLFEKILSADSVKRLKPSPAPYRFAAREMGAAVSEMYMIAAHAWDVTGALCAGAHAAFLARPGMALDPLAPPPDIVGRDLAEVAAQIIAKANHSI
jgi:2-haloacid dehalogenase